MPSFASVGLRPIDASQATLELKLRILTVRKLLQHNSAMYQPTTRQMAAGVVLAPA